MKLKKITTTNGKTNNGWIVPVFNINEPFFDNYSIEFIYISSVRPHMSKGPKLHNKRDSMLICISEKADIVTRINGQYIINRSDANHPEIIHIHKKVPFCIFNPYNIETVVLNLANRAWSPDDDDDIEVTDWDYNHEI